MLTLVPRRESEEVLNDAFNSIALAIMDVAEEATDIGMGIFADVVRDIFATDGGTIGEYWAPLSERTMSERLALGYPKAGPILRREDFLLDSLTDPTMGPQTIFVNDLDCGNVPHQGGNQVTRWESLGHVHFRLATLDDRFEVLYYGDGSGTTIEDFLFQAVTGSPDVGELAGVPPRPMVPGEDHAELVGKPLEARLVQIVDKRIKRG